MPPPTRLIPIPRTLAAALGLLTLVILMLLTPPGWHSLGAVAVVALVVVIWLDDRSFLSHRTDLAAHDRSQTLLAERIVELDAEARAVRAVFNAVPTPILIITASGRVARCNPSAIELFATGGSTPAGRELEDLIPHPELFALFDQARAGEVASARLRLMINATPRYFDVRSTPIPAELFPEAPQAAGHAGETSRSHQAVVLSVDDVTSLAETVRLKTDFAANASHELRTPIAAIRGAVETLAVAKDDPEMSARLCEMISRHSGRLEDLVKDLLDLSRLESADAPPVPELVDLTAIAGSLESHSERTRNVRDVGLVFEFEPALDGMQLDPGLLELILRNLIENACKFAHEGTDVRVIGQRMDGFTPPPASPTSSGAFAAFGLETDRTGDPSFGGVGFKVIDKGQGIPLKHQQRVFERFFQVDPGRDAQREYRGTGLGLAIVKHAVRRLGGRVEIQSVLQEGTTVTVEFPNCLPTRDPSPR